MFYASINNNNNNIYQAEAPFTPDCGTNEEYTGNFDKFADAPIETSKDELYRREFLDF